MEVRERFPCRWNSPTLAEDPPAAKCIITGSERLETGVGQERGGQSASPALPWGNKDMHENTGHSEIQWNKVSVAFGQSLEQEPWCIISLVLRGDVGYTPLLLTISPAEAKPSFRLVTYSTIMYLFRCTYYHSQTSCIRLHLYFFITTSGLGFHCHAMNHFQQIKQVVYTI